MIEDERNRANLVCDFVTWVSHWMTERLIVSEERPLFLSAALQIACHVDSCTNEQTDDNIQAQIDNGRELAIALINSRNVKVIETKVKSGEA